MAGNKINTKKKDDKSKSSRSGDQVIEETEDIDFSLLRKPVLTSITGFAQARKIFDVATEELKGLLSNECDLLYECKVCRNIFRSLANFISHKRVYCKEKFNSSTHSHFLKVSLANEVLKIRKLEESYQESLSEKTEAVDVEDDDSRIPVTKDLTTIVEKITKNKGVMQSELENKQLVFQKIPKSSVAVFQNVETSDKKSDTMRAQVTELNNILSQENAVLQTDGTFKVQSDDKVTQNADTVIQISDDDDNEESDILKCKICDLQFSTLKTLKFHIKYKHLENRLVYPCPDCLDIFSTSWSVYRHLFKVHRKTAAQIRRLRESIQAKAFRMNNPPAFYEKRKTAPKIVPTQKITEEERLYKENQAWLEELDGEGDGRRCGGCGRAFERRAALVAHINTCARRHKRRIQIQIRKDYNKEPNPYLSLTGTIPAIATETKSSSEEIQTAEKVLQEKDKEENPLEEAELDIIDNKNKPEEEMETDETVVQRKKKFFETTMINKLPFAQQIEKNNLNAFKQKIQLDIDIDKRSCKKCDVRYDRLNELLDHMAGHYKWVRYACKLCNFKHFNFEKLPEHVKIVHKLKGNTDFYLSTVKAVDGSEALELSESVDDSNEVTDTSPDSRRPSRCSSDSSRLSDDSSCSSSKVEVGSRKRKCNFYKNNPKRKREVFVADCNDQKEEVSLKDSLLGENDTVPNNKVFEENSSDFDDIEEKSLKRHNSEIFTSVASRRPIRKKTKPKNADFEYDLSNLLKMEAQGYRDSQTVGNKVIQSKKKTSQDLQNNYEIINKDCFGAMITLSRKSVENAQGHMKTASFPVFKTKESRISSIFARPMIPKVSRMDKVSPKKIEMEEMNDISIVSKVAEPSNSLNVVKDIPLDKNPLTQLELDDSDTLSTTNVDVIKTVKDTTKNEQHFIKILQDTIKTSHDTIKTLQDTIKTSQNTIKPSTGSIKTTEDIIKTPIETIKTKQDSFKIIKDNIQIPQDIIKVPQETIKTSQDTIKTSQDTIKISQNTIKPSKFSIKTTEDINKTPIETIKTKQDSFKIIKDNIQIPQDIIKVPQDTIKTSQDTIKTSQDTIKISQNTIKPSKFSIKTTEDINKTPIETIKTKQDSFKIIKDNIQIPQDIIKVPQDTIKTSQDTIKTSQDTIKISQNTIKPLKGSIKTEDIIKTPIETIKTKQDSFKIIKDNIQIPQDIIKVPQDNIKIPHDTIKVKTIDAILNELNKDRTLSGSDKDKNIESNETNFKLVTETEKISEKTPSEICKPNLNKVPLNFRRESFEVIKNPIIKKNITDFTKAGMKTKILVIKPINRNADGSQNLSAPLKFQTIKLKEPIKTITSIEEKKSDQVVVVQVPKVDGTINRSISNTIVKTIKPCQTISDSTSSAELEKSENVLSNNEITPNGEKNIAISKQDEAESFDKKDQPNSQSHFGISEPVKIVNEVMDTDKVVKQDS